MFKLEVTDEPEPVEKENREGVMGSSGRSGWLSAATGRLRDCAGGWSYTTKHMCTQALIHNRYKLPGSVVIVSLSCVPTQ